jgi:tRNA G46 methylase TrmB
VSTTKEPDTCWISVEVPRKVRNRLAKKAREQGIKSLAPYVRLVLTQAAK